MKSKYIRKGGVGVDNTNSDRRRNNVSLTQATQKEEAKMAGKKKEEGKATPEAEAPKVRVDIAGLKAAQEALNKQIAEAENDVAQECGVEMDTIATLIVPHVETIVGLNATYRGRQEIIIGDGDNAVTMVMNITPKGAKRATTTSGTKVWHIVKADGATLEGSTAGAICDDMKYNHKNSSAVAVLVQKGHTVYLNGDIHKEPKASSK